MARASTRIAITSDRVDWTIIVSLAHRRTGRVSAHPSAALCSGKAPYQRSGRLTTLV
jgi:hypothetical protein